MAAQETTDLTLEKTRVTKDVITIFTGKPPKDYMHIHDVKTVIENFPHPNVVHAGFTNTVPISPGDVWEKMTDWHQLTPTEQNSTKNFLMERFSVEDLELAYDEYYPKHGTLPTVHDYRVFILNWEAQMKAELETKDNDIQNLTANQSNLRMALDHTVNISVSQQDQINSLLGDNMSLQDENVQLTQTKDRLAQDKGQLEDNVRQLRSDVSSRDKTISQQGRVVSYLRRDVAQQSAQCAELKTKNKQLCRDKQQLAVENTDLKTENIQKDGTISQLQTENTQLQTENTQKDGTIKSHEVALNKKDGKITNLRKDNIMLYEKLKETTEICDEKDRLLRIQKMKVDDLSYQMSETGDRIARLEKVNEEKCEEINRLIGHNNEQAQHIRQQDDTINDLTQRLREQERINRDLYTQIAELRRLVLQQIAAAEE